MPQRLIVGMCLLALCAACGAKPTEFDWNKYQPPDWRTYQARAVAPDHTTPAGANFAAGRDAGTVTFHDLKTESDQSLARRLLGAVGQRIAYIDRHQDRWQYYREGN